MTWIVWFHLYEAFKMQKNEAFKMQKKDLFI